MQNDWKGWTGGYPSSLLQCPGTSCLLFEIGFLISQHSSRKALYCLIFFGIRESVQTLCVLLNPGTALTCILAALEPTNPSAPSLTEDGERRYMPKHRHTHALTQHVCPLNICLPCPLCIGLPLQTGARICGLRKRQMLL